jgi:mono/diheme cytochrome c family protein
MKWIIGVCQAAGRRCLPLLACAALLTPAHLSAEVATADQKKLDSLDQSFSKAKSLYLSKKYSEMGKVVDEIEKTLEELKSSDSRDEIAPLLTPMETRLSSAQRLLKTALDKAATEKKPPMVANKPMPTKPGAPSAAGGLSFVKDIAPLFVNRCGNCHMNNPKGGFSVASYDSIMKGSDAGRVVFPGKEGGQLIDLLVSGDMPRGGKMPDAEIVMIEKWQQMGAKFDGGNDTSIALATLVGGAPAATTPAMPINTRPTGNEKVSFMRDIAPVLVGRCARCHGGDQGADNFRVETFQQLMRGGQSGSVVTAGKPAESIIVQMLRGTAKGAMNVPRRRMPDRERPLDEAIIKNFETWIAEGAKFDGESQTEDLDFLLRVIKAGQMTHDELAAWRGDLAPKTWSLGNPTLKSERVEGSEFAVVSDLPPARLSEVVSTIEAETKKVMGLFKLNGKPLLKGKVTLFVFDKRLDYSEFTRMVEKRETSNDLLGHLFFNVVDCYACLMAPKDPSDMNFTATVAEQLAAAHVESLGKKTPMWFAAGTGRMIATRVEPRSPLLKQWNEGIQPALASAGKPDQILTAKELSAGGEAIAYGFVRYLASGAMAGRHSALLEALGKGAAFDQAFQQAYGGTPANAMKAWLATGGR